jgi:transcriptional regulator with XRE-family HTH domain
MKLRGLRQARQKQGMSISQLAELSDLRRETITRAEHGQDDVTPSIIHRLMMVLGVSQRELLDGTVPPPTPHLPIVSP